MTYTITSDSDAITLNDPTSLTQTTTKHVENYVFADDTDAQLDIGKTTHSITLTGTEVSSATSNMNKISTIMDAQEGVAITGLSDTNLNVDYLISSLSFNQASGEIDRYNYSITLERVWDRLG